MQKEIYSNIAHHFVENDYNVVHGRGNSRIMGEMYRTAQKSSQKNPQGMSLHNLAIIVEPLWRGMKT